MLIRSVIVSILSVIVLQNYLFYDIIINMSSSGRNNKSNKSNKTIKNKNLAAIGQQPGTFSLTSSTSATTAPPSPPTSPPSPPSPPTSPPSATSSTSSTTPPSPPSSTTPPSPPSSTSSTSSTTPPSATPSAPPLTTQIFLDLDDKPYKTIDADTKIVDIENKIILEGGKYILGMYASFHIENKKITEFGDPIVNDTIENNGIPILILTDTSLLVDSLITDYNDNVVKQRFKSATSNSPINPPKIPTTSIDDDFPDYVEEQIFPDCGVHAINNLFQCRMYKIDELSDISKYSTIDIIKNRWLKGYQCIITTINKNFLGLRRCFGMIIELNGTFSVITKYYRSNYLRYTYIGSDGEIIKFDNHDRAFNSIKKWTSLCFVLRDYSLPNKKFYVADLRMLKPAFDLTLTNNLQTIKDHIDDPVGYVKDPNYSKLVSFLRTNHAIPKDLGTINDIDDFKNAADDLFDPILIPPILRKRVETRPPPQNVLDQVKAELTATVEAEADRLKKIEEDRKEAARKEAEQEEKDRLEKIEEDRLANIEADRIAAEKAEQDRLAKIEADRIAAEQAEKDRLAKIEADGLEAQKGKMEAELLLAQTRAEKDKLAEEIADIQKKLVKIETDRLAAEQAEKDRLEATRLAEVARLAAEQAETDRLKLKIAQLTATLANVVPGVGLASAVPIQNTAPGLPNTGIGLGTALGGLTEQELLQKVKQLEELLVKNNIKVVPQYSLDYINKKIAENETELESLQDTKENKKKRKELSDSIQDLYESKSINPEFIQEMNEKDKIWKKSVEPVFEKWYKEMKKVIPKNFGDANVEDLKKEKVPDEIAKYLKDNSRRKCFELISNTPDRINNMNIIDLQKCSSSFDIREQVAMLRNFPEIFTGAGAEGKNRLKSGIEQTVKGLYHSPSLKKRNPVYNMPDPNNPKKTVDFLEHTDIDLSDRIIYATPTVSESSITYNSLVNVSPTGAVRNSSPEEEARIRNAELKAYGANSALNDKNFVKKLESNMKSSEPNKVSAIAASNKARKEKAQADALLQAQADASSSAPLRPNMSAMLQGINLKKTTQQASSTPAATNEETPKPKHKLSLLDAINQRRIE
jgi:hypothetical protein